MRMIKICIFADIILILIVFSDKTKLKRNPNKEFYKLHPVLAPYYSGSNQNHQKSDGIWQIYPNFTQKKIKTPKKNFWDFK